MATQFGNSFQLNLGSNELFSPLMYRTPDRTSIELTYKFCWKKWKIWTPLTLRWLVCIYLFELCSPAWTLPSAPLASSTNFDWSDNFVHSLAWSGTVGHCAWPRKHVGEWGARLAQRTFLSSLSLSTQQHTTGLPLLSVVFRANISQGLFNVVKIHQRFVMWICFRFLR